MKTLRKLLLVVASCLTIGSSGWAVPIIDQNQPNNPAYIAGFVQTDLAQSFQQANGNIAGAGIFLQPFVGTSDLVTITLWDALPNAGGNALASASAVGTQGTWVDVFWSPIAITPDTTYFLVFTGNDTLGIAGDVTNPYSRGQTYANPGFQPFPEFDYAFRTYFDNAFVTGVPEVSSTIVLLGIALAGLFAVRSRLSFG